VILSGSLQLPRRCTTIETCPLSFRLHADTLDVATLNALHNPEMQKRPWYAFIETSAARNPVLARLTASGTLTADQVHVRNMTLAKLSTDATLTNGVLVLKSFTATAFDGKLSGALRADFAASPPQFEASGNLDKAAASSLPVIERTRWATGTVQTDFVVNASGLSGPALANSAAATFHFNWRGGTLPGLEERDVASRIADFRGTATLRNGQLVFANSKLTAGSRIYMVSGSASLDRQLGLTLSRGDSPVYQITGTLEKPQVTPVGRAQAQLRP
jgi:hypothetical protein